MFLSAIVPTFNEEENIARSINYLRQNGPQDGFEIIISDGGSTDRTVEITKSLGVRTLISPVKGRAGQMNFGAKNAAGDVLYFLHADCLPPNSFYSDIKNSISKKFDSGSFRTKFDSDSLLLKVNAFFTRFNYLFFRGGDQSIFVTKNLFEKLKGFDENMLIMEDYDFLAKLFGTGNFKLIPKSTLISARKYEQNSYLTVQKANFTVVKMYKNGASQDQMISTYKRLLNYRKNAF